MTFGKCSISKPLLSSDLIEKQRGSCWEFHERNLFPGRQGEWTLTKGSNWKQLCHAQSEEIPTIWAILIHWSCRCTPWSLSQVVSIQSKALKQSFLLVTKHTELQQSRRNRHQPSIFTHKDFGQNIAGFPRYSGCTHASFVIPSITACICMTCKGFHLLCHELFHDKFTTCEILIFLDSEELHNIFSHYHQNDNIKQSYFLVICFWNLHGLFSLEHQKFRGTW